jgi:hypothetical protein
MLNVFLKVDILTWLSNKHNMGMAFDRRTWNQIKACGEVSRSFAAWSVRLEF